MTWNIVPDDNSDLVMHRALTALVVGTALAAGCGSEEATDQKEAADVARRWLAAIIDDDWKAACATRTKEERAHFARVGGSCEQALEKAHEAEPVDNIEEIQIGDVRIEGDRADVEVHQPGRDGWTDTLIAVREDGRWLLESPPDDETP